MRNFQTYNLKMLNSLFQVASVTVIHVPDDKYRLSARVLFQYLLTSKGNMYELKVCQNYLTKLNKIKTGIKH